MNVPHFRNQVLAFLRSRIGRSFLVFALLSALLCCGVGYGFYHSNLRWFLINKGEEKITALELVDAFVTEYAGLRNALPSSDAPVPASFRAHAISRFNKSRGVAESLRMKMVGPPGREIATPPGDAATASVIARFATQAAPKPETAFVTVGSETLLRTIYPTAANQQSCVDCHNKLQPNGPRWQLHDIIGAFVVDVPTGPFFRRNLLNSVAVGAIMLMLSLAIGLYVFMLHYRQFRAAEAATDRLMQSEERFKDYAETASDWYWQTGPDHRFTFFSDRLRAFGIDPDKRIGKTRIEVAADADGEAEKWRAHKEALDRREPFRDFTYLLQGDGEGDRHFCASGKPFFDQGGRFRGYRGTGRDVTGSVAAARRLNESIVEAERANRSKSEFLANMSHELRTPLNAILGFSEIIRDQILGPISVSKYSDYAGDIHASGRHLLEIINDILDMSKIEAGKLELRDDVIDVERALIASLRLVEERAKFGKIDLVLDPLPVLPLLRADEVRVKQIMLNLITNAVKFTGEGGRVAVSAALGDDGSLEVRVQDTGIGMTEAEIAVALQPFRQVDNGLSRRYEGTGLGLPLVKALVEVHQGRLVIQSRKSAGTTATVIFPRDRLVAARGQASVVTLRVEA